MVGNLLDDSKIRFQLSESAENLCERLMDEVPDRRPTAIDALDDDWFKEII